MLNWFKEPLSWRTPLEGFLEEEIRHYLCLGIWAGFGSPKKPEQRHVWRSSSLFSYRKEKGLRVSWGWKRAQGRTGGPLAGGVAEADVWVSYSAKERSLFLSARLSFRPLDFQTLDTSPGAAGSL